MDSPILTATGGNEAAAESSRTLHRAAPAPALPPLRPNPAFETSAVADKLAAHLAAYQQPDTNVADDIPLIRKAYAVAYEAHEGQTRSSGEPYIDHPVAVALILLDLRLDAASIAAALLHDVVEDTSVTKEQVAQLFGDEIAHLVDGVTKLTVLEAQTKEEAQAGTYRKMFIAMADDPRVVLVKLADRLHNMRTLGSLSIERQRRIARETLEIYAPLAERLGIWQIRWELEDRAFAVLEPEKYAEIAGYVASRSDWCKRVSQRMRARLRQATEKEGIKTEIALRSRHIYSIYRKMERKGLSLEQVYDRLGLRVFVDTVGACYQVLGIIHSIWPPIPGEFDDYVANPKESMYQSLHTAVLIPGGQPCEIQIRTYTMHEVAEHGIAAHWHYIDDYERFDASFESKLAWLRGLMEWRRDLTDAQEFVDSLKSDVLEEQVYVFTPKGKIIDLPVGSTPVDFAYTIHTQIGHSCVGAKVNNRMVPLDYQLQSGEIVQIMTAKNVRGPDRTWLNFVKTSGARTHIRRYFKRLQRGENEAAGRDLLQQELKRLGLRVPVEQVAQLYNAKTSEDLFAQIGSGDITAREVAERVLAQRTPAAEEDELSALPQLAPAAESSSQTGIQVRGMDGQLARLAKCCHPTAGEPIVGYVTRGKGVTIHRADCRTILNRRDRDRLLEVTWGQAPATNGSAVPVRIEAWDRV
ncbi:MAG TPA: bifunctional (p)ppGpp synthetase/guanosine-3',5'-bis(diphosphate) 3'-pyrophosphohydrolase, partial [Roseiflexaceae bacterium]|nr:bifunctional (p)ppGpp synthetase/guanosine-3',5'-bis(diphosphate) 3'-pyrophosphohydrolase [Roseiflexaceae bacterium]